MTLSTETLTRQRRRPHDKTTVRDSTTSPATDRRCIESRGRQRHGLGQADSRPEHDGCGQGGRRSPHRQITVRRDRSRFWFLSMHNVAPHSVDPATHAGKRSHTDRSSDRTGRSSDRTDRRPDRGCGHDTTRDRRRNNHCAQKPDADVDTGPAGEHKTAAHLDRHGETTLTEMTERAWSKWTEATIPQTHSRMCGLASAPAEPHSQVPAAPHA